MYEFRVSQPPCVNLTPMQRASYLRVRNSGFVVVAEEALCSLVLRIGWVAGWRAASRWFLRARSDRKKSTRPQPDCRPRSEAGAHGSSRSATQTVCARASLCARARVS